MKSAYVVESPIGLLTLVEAEGALAELRFGKNLTGVSLAETPLLLRAAQELQEYFCGQRRSFEVKLAPSGTPFQQKCWQALCEIPYGETRTYRQQAESVGNAKACRAAGMANHRNPIPIVIPCHRVVGQGGRLTGYGGGIAIKEALLALERKHLI